MTYNPPPGGYPPPPPPSPYGSGPALPQEVSIVSILLFISGGFSVLTGLLSFAISGLGAFFALLGIVLLAIGGAEIYTGLELRKLTPWARMAAIALAGVGALFSLVLMIKGGYTGIISIGIDAYIIYALTRPNVVAAFPQG